MQRHYILIYKDFKNFICNKLLFWNLFFFLNLGYAFGGLGFFLRVVSDNKIKMLLCLFSFPEQFHNRLWFMEKIARVFPRAGPDPSTRQQPFLCTGKGVLGIWFTDRFCPTVESEMVYQELLPSPCSHQKKETEKSGRNKRRQGNGT